MTAPFGYTVLLQARRRVSDAWADIDPAQVEALSKLGNQIRAIQTVGPAAAPAVGGEDTQDDLAGRRKRLSETVILIGKALEAGRSLASIFPLEEDALQQAKDTVAKRLALLNTACYEFKTTFHHDLAAALPASPLRIKEATAAQHFDLPKGEPARFVRNGILEVCQCSDCVALTPPASPLRGTREQIATAVRKVLDDGKWPEYLMQDDNGLEDYEYVNFIMDVFAKVPAARETCIECGKCDPCDDDCPNYIEPIAPAKQPLDGETGV